MLPAGEDHGGRPWAVAVLALIGLGVEVRSGRRGRLLAIALLVACAAAAAGCGSDRRGGVRSEQTVTAIGATTGSGPVVFDGLPVSLGTVSRR